MATAIHLFPKPGAMEHLSCGLQIDRVSGLVPVLERLQELAAIVAGTPQQYELRDVPYFLARPHRLGLKPHLMLLYQLRDGAHQTLLGGVLLLEFHRIFLTSDSKGRRCVFAPEGLRIDLAATAARFLVDRGARFVSVDVDSGLTNASFGERTTAHQQALSLAGIRLQGARGRLDWALESSIAYTHMPLNQDFDATLAPLGRKARKNLRRYRRLAIRELGARFVPNAFLTEPEFTRLAAESHFPVEPRTVRWRYNSLKRFDNTFLCGLQAPSGMWLCAAGCRRNGSMVEIDWQMNRRGYEVYSLVTALRSSILHHECARGTAGFTVEGGDLHQMGESFPANSIYHLAVRRPGSLFRWALETLLKHLRPLHILTTSLLRPHRLWISTSRDARME